MERALMYPNGPSSCQHNKQGMTDPAICSVTLQSRSHTGYFLGIRRPWETMTNQAELIISIHY